MSFKLNKQDKVIEFDTDYINSLKLIVNEEKIKSKLATNRSFDSHLLI
jgi:hypothetical protein